MSKLITMLDQVLIAYEESLRQTGRTTAIARKARETNAIMVCHDYPTARVMSNDFGIKTIALDTYLNPDHGRGQSMFNSRYVFDHMVEYVLIQKKLKEVERIINESLDTNYTRF